MEKVTRAALIAAWLLALGFSSATSFAQVNYKDSRQRNPAGDRQVEEGFQRHQREYRQRQSGARSVDSSSDTARGAPPSDEGGKPGPGSEGVRSQRPPLYAPPPRPVPGR